MLAGTNDTHDPPPQVVSGPPGASVLESIDEQARVDPDRPETAFVVGPNYYFKKDHGEFRYLVSLSVTTYQGLMFRVCTFHCARFSSGDAGVLFCFDQCISALNHLKARGEQV
jgi:hypothetical protein